MLPKVPTASLLKVLPPASLKHNKWLRQISLFSILLPICLSLAVSVHLGNQLVPFMDQDVYLDQAYNLAHGVGLKTSFNQLEGFVQKDGFTSFWGAGAQMLYALDLLTFGPNYLLMRMVNAILFGITLWYTRSLFLLWLTPLTANLAVFVLGCNPYFIIFNQLFLTEMPFILCQQAFVFHLFQASRISSSSDSALAGLFAGASIVIRAVLSPILPLALLLLLVRAGKTRLRPGLAAMFLASLILVAAPYCIANSTAVGKWFPLGGKGDYNLWFFNADVHNHPFWQEDFLRSPPHPNWYGLDEKQKADLVGNIGRTWISGHPLQFSRLALIKGVAFLNPIPKHMASGGILKVTLTFYSFGLLSIFAVGLSTLQVTNREHVFVIALFLMYLSIDMVFMPASRHRMLYDPFFALVGMRGLWTYFHRLWPKINTVPSPTALALQ